jgi:NAD(P)-dependent dehydrogenase (short-subunit alcohol dehydrogenase family)
MLDSHRKTRFSGMKEMEERMTGILAGEVALVTGAGRGFGRAIAERFAREGAAVALVARSTAQIEDVAEAIRAGGGRAAAIPADVTVRADVEEAVRSAEEQLGPLSLLVNNAGVPGPFGPFWELDPDEWWASQGVHIRAPVLFLRSVLPGMRERGHGRIIVVSALASRLVAPFLSAYCTGKIAQTRIVEEAAAELAGTPIAVFAIDPGFVITELARETMSAPAAQKWLPHMVERLSERADASGGDEDLGRCAQRCVDLASGRYDALSGRYMELPDDLDAMVEAARAKEAETAA